MRKGLPYFIFIFSLLIAFSGVDALGQGREDVQGKDDFLPSVLRGQRDNIDDLESNYCSLGGSDDVYVNPTDVPAGTAYITWTIKTNVGTVETHPDWVDNIGSNPNNGVEFFPDRVDTTYYGNIIRFEYYFWDSAGGPVGAGYDDTYVRKSPNLFDFTADQEICEGETADLILSGSESGYEYYLHTIDLNTGDVSISNFPVSGDGNPITFTVSQEAEYQVEARRSDSPGCPRMMNGNPVVTVNSVPTPDPQSNGPVCQNEEIHLFDGNPEASGYIYTWYGPGLDAAGVTGHSITVTDPTVIGTAGDYDYQLTIVDSNYPTGCSNSGTLTVTVQELPSVAPTNEGPVCDGATNVGLYANPTGGSGDYSFNWTSNPAGFTSTDENPVLASVSIGVDDREYIVEVTDNVTGCVSESSGTTSLVIHQNPSVSIQEGDQTVCQGEDVTYTADVTGSGTYSYQWYLNGGVLSGETSPVLTIGGASLPAVGAHTVSVEVTDTSTPSGCSSTENAALTVNEKPEGEITALASVCAGDNVTFNANLLSGPGSFPDDYTISWTTPYGSESGEQFTLNNVDEATHAGTYTLNIVYNATGCSDQFQHNLIINTVTPGLSVNPGTEICQGTPVEFTGTGGVNYEFSIDDGSGYTVVQALSADDTYGPVVLNDGDIVKILVEDANGCRAESTPLTMTVNERPVIDGIGNNGPYCVDDDPVELSSTVSGGDISTSGAYTYSWTGPDGFTSSLQNPSFGPATSLMSGTYTLVVTDDNGCVSDPATTDLVVNSLPEPSATNTGPVCGNGNNSITLEGDPDGLITYQWFDPDDVLLGSTQDYTLNNVFPDDSGIYRMSVTDDNGCQNITTTEVVIYEIPVVSLGSDISACETSDVSLTATITTTTSGPYIYTWYKDEGSGPVQIASAQDLDTFTLTNVDNTDEATYSVVVNDVNGCASASDALILTVNPLPSVNPSANDICASPDNDILLEGGPDDLDYLYSWSGPGLSGTVTGQDISVTDDAITGTPGVYTYTLTTESSSTGCTNSATVDVEVFQNPVVSIDPVAAVCDGGAFTVTANVSGGSGDFSYSWTFTPEGGGASSGLPYTSNTFNVDPADINDAGTYEVTAVDNITGCSTVENVVVTVNELPTVSLADVATCEGTDVTLTAVASGGSGNYVNYSWYDDGGTLIINTTTNELTLSGSDVELSNDGVTYSVIVEDDSGCLSTSDNMVLTINENPEIVINSGDPIVNVCPGSDLVLNANITSGSGSYTESDILWSLPDGTTQTGSQITIPSDEVNQDDVYSVTVTDDLTCEATASAQVNIYSVNPALSVTPGSSVCEGTSLDFTASGGVSYEFFHYDSNVGGGTWSSVQGPAASDVWNSPDTDIVEDGDSIYVVVETADGCFVNSSTIGITIFTNPTVSLSFPGGSNEVCENSDLTIEATSGYSNYIFYVNGVEAQNGSSHQFTSNSFDNNDEVYVTASSGVGCTASSTPETIVVNGLPTATANNTGPACEGQSITLQGGDAGLSYEWFAPGDDPLVDSPISTTIDYDLNNISLGEAGTYTLVVTDGNSCQNLATTDVVVNDLPVVDLGGDIEVCDGTSDFQITSNITGGSSPYSVEWEFEGTSVLSGQDENVYTIASVDNTYEGEYVVTVTDANNCVSIKDTVYLTVNPAPSVSITSDGSSNEYCNETQVTLTAQGDGGTVSGSDPAGYEYVWYHDGAVIPGVSTQNYSFIGENGTNDGLYEVIAIDDNGNGCASLYQSLNLVIHELPDASLDVDPAFFIEGTNVTFTAVDGYDSYEFLVNGTTVQGPGVDYVYEDNSLQDGDEVTVIVTEDHGTVQCDNSSSVTMSVFDSVDQPIVRVTDSEYCEGSPGATVGVTNPQQDVTYELVYEDGTSVTGYGPIIYDGSNSVIWNNVLDDNGGDNTSTTFRVKAYWATLTPDGDQFSSSFDITEHLLPNQFTMSVDDASAENGITVSDCNAGSGYTIGLHDGWQAVDYILLLNGNQVLEVKSGSGVTSNFSFDNTYSLVGDYTIVAQSSFGCTTDIIGSFTIQGDAVTTFELSAENSGLYCEGDSDGVGLTLSGSEVGLDYELFLDGVPVDTVSGDGNAISFGNYTDEGQYSVQVNSTNGCIYPMNGVVDVQIVDKPASGILTALPEDSYCIGGIGVNLQLSGQEENHTYYLMYEDAVVATHNGDASGNDVNFVNDADGTEYFTSTGDYYVIAETNNLGCSSDPSDTVTVSNYPLPENRPIVGVTEFCEGGSTELFIENTQANVEYQLIDVGADPDVSYGSPQVGNGGALAFIVSDSSSYTLSAVNTLTGCIRPVFEDTVLVDDLSSPDSNLDVSVAIVSVTGEACGTEKAVITIQSPEQNVTYSLFREGNSSASSSITITDAGLPNISFQDSIQDNNGDYYIIAESLSGCSVRIDTVLTGITTAGSIANVGLTTDDTNICQGDGAVTISTTSSETGVNYSLRYASSDIVHGQSESGTGSPINFSPAVSTDSYFYLEANDGSGCIKVLDSIRIIFNPLPKSFELTGAETYCGSSEGALIGLSGSEFRVEYNLVKENEGLIDTKEGKLSGDTILFDEPADIGSYTVFARNIDTGCTSSMKDTIKVSYSDSGPLTPIIVAEDTVSLCGEAYFEIYLESPEDGVTYHLFDSNDEELAETVADSEGLESPFRIIETGEYTVSASRNGSCMSESDTIWVEAGSIPLVNELLLDYQAYVCATETGYIRYDISEDPDDWTYSIITRNSSGDDVLYRSEEDAQLSQNNDSLIWTIDNSGEYLISVTGCETEYSNKIRIEIADPIEAPKVLQDTFRYCHDFRYVDINVQKPGSNSIIFHLYEDDTLNELTDLSPVYGGASEPVFESVPDGRYLIRSVDLSNGCFSNYTEPIVVESHVLPTDTVFWLDLTGNETDIEYLAGGEVSLNLDMSVLDPGFDYIVRSFSNDSFIFDVNEGNGEVIISQRGNDYLTYGIYSSDCPAYPVTLNQLSIREDSIDARDAHMYLSEGENSDTILVQVAYTDFDEGQLEYFFLNEDTTISIGLIGDYSINPNTGLVSFDKAPSFYGTDRIQYVVRNRNYPERIDTAFIYVYVGNSNLSEDKSIFIPNAFSPNNDGLNDFFVIESNSTIAEESTLEVYNRWGTIVYRSDGKNYANDWDGTSNLSSMVSIGEDLPNGVYFYVYTITANVDGDIVNKKFNGYIELRR